LARYWGKAAGPGTPTNELQKGNIMRNLGIKALAAVLLSTIAFGAFAAPRHYHHRHHHHRHPVVVIHHR
jgi:hypothetical protein